MLVETNILMMLYHMEELTSVLSLNTETSALSIDESAHLEMNGGCVIHRGSCTTGLRERDPRERRELFLDANDAAVDYEIVAGSAAGTPRGGTWLYQGFRAIMHYAITTPFGKVTTTTRKL